MTRKIATGTRFRVLHRDGFRCVYCGATPTEALLELDHILPHRAGGRSTAENLVTACQPCNVGKAAMLLENYPASLTPPQTATEAWANDQARREPA